MCIYDDEKIRGMRQHPVFLSSTARSLLLFVFIIFIGSTNCDDACDGLEIIAPSEHQIPKIGVFSLQYARLFETIGWCYLLHIRNQRYEFPGANFLFEEDQNNNETFHWNNVFKPIGKCPAVKTVRTLLEFSGAEVNDFFISGMARFLVLNLVYQPSFRSEIDNRKKEWKNYLNISNSPYVAFHMRRTDKVGTEAAFSSAIQYLSHLLGS